MSEKKVRVGFIGECMLEMSASHSKLKFGGDTLNSAVYFSRLNFGQYETYYLSALGDDSLSDGMIGTWEDEGIDVRFVDRIAGKLPGLYMIETDEQGERSFHFWRGESAAKDYLKSDTLDVAIKDKLLDVIYMSGISIAIYSENDRERLYQKLLEFKSNGGKIVFDNNYRPKLWVSPDEAKEYFEKFLGLCDFALLTEDDEFALTRFNHSESLIEYYRQSTIPEIVVKRGGYPAVIIQKGEVSQVPGKEIAAENVVDTTAAGDAFGAAYMSNRLKDESPLISARAAHRLASTVIQFHGAIIPKSDMPV